MHPVVCFVCLKKHFYLFSRSGRERHSFGIAHRMQHYTANASVVFTDAEGNHIDTFVIFDTDAGTGLTHINHENLRVPADRLRLHAKTASRFHLPLEDAFSFEMLKKLREKYQLIDAQKAEIPVKIAEMQFFAKAS